MLVGRDAGAEAKQYPRQPADEGRRARGRVDGQERRGDDEPSIAAGSSRSNRRDQPTLEWPRRITGDRGALAHLAEGGSDVGHVVLDIVDVHASPLAPAMAAVVHGMHGEAGVVQGGGGQVVAPAVLGQAVHDEDGGPRGSCRGPRLSEQEGAAGRTHGPFAVSEAGRHGPAV
jgi:hypothetical protein